MNARCEGPHCSRLSFVFLLMILFLAVAASVCAAEPAAAEDASHTEYSVLYGGNGSADDAHRFSNRLYYHGTDGTWYGKTQTSWDSPQTDVAHWDVTNGWPGADPWPGANQRDIMYLSTHGWPNQMRFYNPSYVGSLVRRLDQNDMPDNIGPMLGGSWGSPVEPNRWEVGATYQGQSTTITNSRWNDDIEWVFLGVCSQLSATGGSRAAYARTLLGTPQRAHSIMGYSDVAPGDTGAVDVAVVDLLFSKLGAGRSIRYSWLSANAEKNNNNAAMVLHAKHEYEGLPPVAPRETDSPAGGAVDIQYWYLLLGQITPGNVSPWTQLFDDWFGAPRAYATTSPTVVKGAYTTYRLKVPLPENPGYVVSLEVRPGSTTPMGHAEGILGTGAYSSHDLLDPRVSVFSKDGRCVQVFADDNLNVQEGREYGGAVGFDSEAALRYASDYLKLGVGLPADAEVARVDEVRGASLDPQTGELSNDKTYAYVVRYEHSFGGTPIAGADGDGIAVTVASQGDVCGMNRTWRTVMAGEDKVRVIGPDEALNTLAREGERALSLPPLVDVTRVRMVYYSNNPSVEQRSMGPAWEFMIVGSDSKEPVAPQAVYVDAQSGELLTD